MENTGISWTDHTFNPWIGCTKVSSGCDHCYAEILDKRMAGGGHWGPGVARRVTSESYWRNPIKWNQLASDTGTRTKVFCASMADVFDGEAPREARERLWDLIRDTPHLDWQLLTKRPANIRRYLPDDWNDGYQNIWLGVSTDNREQALRRIPILQSIPAAVRFISAEPLLGDLGELNLAGMDWTIIGGESGGGARPFDLEWADHLVQQSRLQGVSVFVKQLGKRPVSVGSELVILKPSGRRDGHAGDPELWPEQAQALALREFPAA